MVGAVETGGDGVEGGGGEAVDRAWEGLVRKA